MSDRSTILGAKIAAFFGPHFLSPYLMRLPVADRLEFILPKLVAEHQKTPQFAGCHRAGLTVHVCLKAHALALVVHGPNLSAARCAQVQLFVHNHPFGQKGFEYNPRGESEELRAVFSGLALHDLSNLRLELVRREE